MAYPLVFIFKYIKIHLARFFGKQFYWTIAVCLCLHIAYGCFHATMAKLSRVVAKEAMWLAEHKIFTIYQSL